MFAAFARALTALALLCLFAMPAVAGVVDASALVLLLKPWLDAAASAVITAVVAAVGIWARRWFGLDSEARMREALHSGLTTGAAAAIAMISDAAARKLSRIEIESELVAAAVTYALKATPDAVRFFGLDEARLAEMARAKLIQLLPAAMQASPFTKS